MLNSFVDVILIYYLYLKLLIAKFTMLISKMYVFFKNKLNYTHYL